MSEHHATIAHNLREIEQRVVEAAERAGRSASEVMLVGVTKYVSVEDCLAIAALGCLELGESRPQQLWQKAADPRLAPVHWHLVGHLQRNKVAQTLPLVSLIHSVDSERLLASIDKHAESMPAPVGVLLEVNTSGEEAKHGFQPEELRRLLPKLGEYRRVAVRGLMTMAAREGGEQVAAASFVALRELRDELARSAPPDVSLEELSMGMSGDFEVAIAEGSTIVRIGSALWKGVN